MKTTAEELEKIRSEAVDTFNELEFYWNSEAQDEVLKIIESIFKKLQEIPAKNS
jgi:hypothetical protein